MFFILSLLLTTWTATAPVAPITVSGQVMSEGTNAPLAGASVVAGAASTVTDLDGRFTIQFDPGSDATPHLTISAPGYVAIDVNVPSTGTGSLEVLLHRSPSYQEEVVVSGHSDDVAATPPTIVLEPLTVSRVAGAGDNVYRVLQTLPGVSAADDFGSRLAVRGGGPDQNLTVMDGVEIHNPYRLFGLTSAFNPDTIDRFELTAGGFSAKYGDRLSSILLVDNRSGARDRRLAGSAALSATDTNLVLEGGLPSGSWLVAARRTYYDLIAERVTDNDLPSFNDLQSKIVWEPHPGRRLTLFALTSHESTDATFDGDRAGDTIGLLDASRNEVVSLSYSTSIGRRTTMTAAVAGYRYRDDLGVNGSLRNESTRSNAADDEGAYPPAAIVFTRALGVRDFSAREDIRVALTQTQTLDVGVDVHAITTDWGWIISGDRNDAAANGSSVIGGAGLPSLLNSTADSARVSAFVEDDVQVTPRIRVAGGARLDWSQLSSETILAPRGRATFALTPRTKVRAAAGLYTQSPGYEKLLQSDYFVDLSNSQALGLLSERSIHTIGGVEHEFNPAVSARVETYFKTFDRMIAGRIETPSDRATRVAQYDFPLALASSIPAAAQVTTVPDNGASGRSWGMDVYLEKRQVTARDRVSGWLSYTWGKATLENYGEVYPFDYDRRHSLSVVSTWRFIPRIDFGATLRVASGFPTSTPIGLRAASVLKEGAVPGAAGSLVPRYDARGLPMWTPDYGGVENLNRARLPLYARLDLRFTYVKSAASRWQFYIEAINALNRDNAGSLTPKLVYDPASDRPHLTLSRDGGLPFFPSAGFRIRF